LTQAAWKTKPSYGIVATEDKSIRPESGCKRFKSWQLTLGQEERRFSNHGVFVCPGCLAEEVSWSPGQARKIIILKSQADQRTFFV
jgi:hypothetical protein